jgi:hypothetical protein
VALHRSRNNNAISVAQDPTGTGIGAMKSCGNPIGHAATTIKLTVPKGLEVEQRSILVDAGNNTIIGQTSMKDSKAFRAINKMEQIVTRICPRQ